MLVKAYLVNKQTEDKIPFLFNPNELNIERTNQYAEVAAPGLPSSTFRFVKGGSRTLTMDLFFDTYEKGTDVRDYTDKITGWDMGSSGERSSQRGLMDIDPELHAPPICVFVWGSLTFPCIIERVSKKFTMFLPEGIPVRATLNVTLKEYKDVETQLKETDKHSPDRTKIWQVKQGDTLWLIAAKTYGNAALWRRIAEKNKIKDPRVLEPGTELEIPPLE